MVKKPHLVDMIYDVTSVVHKGGRDYQEDAIITDFSRGAPLGFAVLSDGMGGHAAGDVASKIVVTEVFSELKFQSGDPEQFVEALQEILLDAVAGANECLSAHSRANPDTAGMGATVVVPVLYHNQLNWISIGDSPLYLVRNGEIEQLNEDHSLAPQIDMMVDAGLLSSEIGRNHPDRSCLTSVLIGEQIEKIDCPKDPFLLQDGDIVLASSDGLQTLTNEDIRDTILENLQGGSSQIADALLEEVIAEGDPNQDNISFCVIMPSNLKKVGHATRPISRRRKTAEIVPIKPRESKSPVTDIELASAKGGSDR